jgi:hypothetical protein
LFIVSLANHPCITMPSTVCQNGGVCTVNELDFICKCATGWSGRNCQTRERMFCFLKQ